MNNKLFVSSINWDTTEETLREFFSQVGEVTECKIIMDREHNRSRGFGFVTFATEEEATKAIEELDGKELEGREIRVAHARPQAPRD